MTDWVTCRAQKEEKKKNQLMRQYAEYVAYAPGNPEHIIYTAKHTVVESRAAIERPPMKPGACYVPSCLGYFIESPYGFLRAICNKQGEVLAYTRALALDKSLLPEFSRWDTWYVFEEFNIKLINDFQTHEILHFPDDQHGAIWTYDSANRCYTLTMPSCCHNPSEDYFFRVDDTGIESDIGESYVCCKYPVKTDTPNEYVVRGVRAALHNRGFLSGPVPPISDSFFQNIIQAKSA